MASPVKKRNRKNPSPVCQWFLTWPRSGDLTKEQVLANLRKVGNEHGGVDKYIVCTEHHEDGALHMHAYVKFGLPGLPRSKLLLFDCGEPKQHGRYESCRSPKGSIVYCQKEDADFITNLPASALESATDRRKARNSVLMKGNVDDLLNSGDISFLALPMLQKARIAHVQMNLQPYDAPECRGVWIYGKPETGKSLFVRRFAGSPTNLYVKNQNKWWDEYQGEPVVLLDDFDTKGACLSHLLKIWSDRYRFRGEVKGSGTPLCYRVFFITSNYVPAQIWPEDSDAELRTAIIRRFIFLSLDVSTTPTGELKRTFSRLNVDPMASPCHRVYSRKQLDKRLKKKFLLTEMLKK